MKIILDIAQITGKTQIMKALDMAVAVVDSLGLCDVIFHKVTVTENEFEKGLHFKQARDFAKNKIEPNQCLSICSWGISRGVLSEINVR